MAVIMAATTTALMIGNGSAAFAAESTPGSSTDAAVAVLRDRLQSYGVPADVRNQLVEKFLDGRELDADTDATPVSSRTTTVNGVEKTRNVYADGSVAIGSIQKPTIDIKSITGCNHRVDSFGTDIFTNCEIAWDATTWSLSWTADYDYNGNGEAITSAKSVHFGGVGDFSAAGTEIVTERADKNGTAIADGFVNQKIMIGPVATTRRVGVRLQVATRWTDRKAKESPFST